MGLFGVKNTVLSRLVTNGKREPLVFDTRDEAGRWFRINGYPEDLVIVDGYTSEVTKAEREAMIQVKDGTNG